MRELKEIEERVVTYRNRFVDGAVGCSFCEFLQHRLNRERRGRAYSWRNGASKMESGIEAVDSPVQVLTYFCCRFLDEVFLISVKSLYGMFCCFSLWILLDD